MSHRILEHTADVAVEIEAAGLPALFSEAAQVLRGLLVESGEIRPRVERAVRVEGEDLPDLLVNWLNEILFLLDTQGLVFDEALVDRLEGTTLEARLRGEPLEEGRHRLGREVKAATYHDLEVIPTPSGWRARLVFDL